MYEFNPLYANFLCVMLYISYIMRIYIHYIKEEEPYGFSRSFVKFQGHTGKKLPIL